MDFAADVWGPLYSQDLFGVVQQFCRFWIWSDTECKTTAEWLWSPTEPHTFILPYTLYAYIQYTYTHSGGRRVELARRGEYRSQSWIVPTQLNVRKKLAISSL
jgi:hypothetical protein